MNSAEWVMLSLVRYALRHESRDWAAELADVDWDEVLTVSSHHGLLGIAFDGMSVLRDENWLDINLEKYLVWLGQAMVMDQKSHHYQDVLSRLLRVFAKNDISVLLLKGLGLARYWPNPNHRPVGDVDIFVFDPKSPFCCDEETGLWKKTDKLVEDALGVKVDTSHHHHTVYGLDGIMVENHYDFFNTKAHVNAGGLEQVLKRLAIENPRRWVENVFLPNANFNALFLIRHLGKHFAGSEINLKQVLDWALFVEHESQQVDWKMVTSVLKEIGIWDFFNQINAICVDYLGFEESLFPTIQRLPNEERIFNDILHPECQSAVGSHRLGGEIVFVFRRFFANGWKRRIVYKDGLLSQFIYGLRAHLLGPKVD